MAVISIHQPNYFPWLGYFKKVYHSEYFIFLDDVQFSKGSYTNRVNILCEGQKKWLTVPIDNRLGLSINNIKLVKNNWKEQHLRIIESYYKKSCYFNEVYSVIEKLLNDINSNNLSEVNILIIKKISNILKINTRIIKASTLNIDGELYGDDRLIAIIKKLDLGGNITYFSGSGGSNYQCEKKFEANCIKVKYINNNFKTYDQIGSSEFINGLSILDALFNVGWEATKKLIK